MKLYPNLSKPEGSDDAKWGHVDRAHQCGIVKRFMPQQTFGFELIGRPTGMKGASGCETYINARASGGLYRCARGERP